MLRCCQRDLFCSGYTVMFGIGMPEMLLIVAVALMVVGPKKLPEMAHAIGKTVARFRSAASGFQRQVEREIRQVDDLARRDHPSPPETGDASPDRTDSHGTGNNETS